MLAKRIAALALAALLIPTGATLATPASGSSAPQGVVDPDAYSALRFRSVGPFRGGRVTAVDGVPGRPFTFLFGATGGGVWRTDNGGHTWGNVTDGYLGVGSVGAVEVADADPNVIYVGTGSACIRGNVSIGDGIYRSTDMGRTWEHAGLPDAGQIGRIVTHPEDPDRVWAAVLGNPFGANPERGVYRSTDGGNSWERVLFVSEETGAVDIALDPSNPRVLYAAMWRAERKPWTVVSGSDDGGLFKSTDGGDSWRRLEGGLPQGLVGRIGVAVSPADPERVWAIVEASDDRSGLYRSDDGGGSWRRTSTQGGLISRPWYYMHVEAHPTDPDTLFVLNSGFYRSVDGGASFSQIGMPHSDQHDLWIDPDNPDVMLMGNDGGATVSVDGGESWSPQFNQPTAEFYSLTVDDAFPYRLYAPQQDNSTISVPSRTTYSGISMQHWRAVGGCETGPIAIKADDPDIVYAGCFGGRLARFDRETEQFRQIRDYPEEMGGMPESELRFRIQWNAPITTSRHDPDVLYHGSQYVHRSRDQGQSWEVISPDLTGNRTEMFGPAGGPITHDITGVEVYSALLAIEEDPNDPGLIWTGSNDGVIHVSRDGGDSWNDVTPPDMPELTTVNRIDPSMHRPGTAYVAAYRYRVDDWRPYVWRTTDYGATWERIADGTRGIPVDWPVRVVREDPDQRGLLFAGTEFGLFVSFDDGGSWQSLQQNLPRTPVTDLRVHRGDLVVATQGRSFWILDDVGPLRELAAGEVDTSRWLFAPAPTYRTSSTTSSRDYDRDRVFGAMMPRAWLGENPADGAIVRYLLPEGAEEVRLEVLDADGVVVREAPTRGPGSRPAAPGMNEWVWDLTWPGPELGRFSPPGPRAVPGRYAVRLTVDGVTLDRPFELRKDPRLTYVTVEDLQAQFDFLSEVQGAIERTQAGIRTIASIRDQLDRLEPRLDGLEVEAEVRDAMDEVRERVAGVEDGLVQTEGGGWAAQPRLMRNLSWVATAASSQRGVRTDARPTDQLVERFGDLASELEALRSELEAVIDGPIARINALLADVELPAIAVDS